MKLSAKLNTIAFLAFAAGCTGRTQQGVVVESSPNNGSSPSGTSRLVTGGSIADDDSGDQGQTQVQASASAGAASALPTAQGLSPNSTVSLFLGSWTGANDENSSSPTWTLGAGGASATPTAPAPSPSPTQAPTAPAPAPTPTPTPTPTASAGLTDQQALQMLQGCAGATCHNHSNDFPDPATAKANVLRRSDMVSQYASQVGVDANAITAWANGAGSGGASTAPTGQTSQTGASSNTLTLTEDSAGNCYNQNVWTGKVGGTVTIQNNCSSGYIAHTNGDPFPHGDVSNPIPPGGSQTYQLQSPVQSGSGNTYRHTDGSDNSATQPLNITVTQ